MKMNKSSRAKGRGGFGAAGKSKAKSLPNISAEVVIDRLAHDGRGIAQLDGKIVFVDHALPLEKHLVKVVAQKSKYSEALSVSIIGDVSTERREPACAYYATCGGCQIQHLAPDAQLHFKSNLVQDQLRRAKLNVEPEKVAAIVSKNTLAYRSRARLSLSHKGSPYAGFKARANSQIIKIDRCLVLDPALDACLAPLQRALIEFRPEVLGHIEMLKTQALPVLVLRHVAALMEPELDALSTLSVETGAEVYLQPDSSADYYRLDGRRAEISFTVSVPHLAKPLRYQISNFSQINPDVNYAMVEQALSWAHPSKEDIWLDLFCGVGNLTLPFAAFAHQVIGVEAIADMVEQAKANAESLAVTNCKFLAADLEKIESLRKLPKKVDGVILDPPRAGAKSVVENISRLKPKKILYISCDAATFARDARTLVESGYDLERVGALDMFPQTMHVETMALFLLR
ncbi:23S rRNA (uracil(1939)-C(5))-methyltransferase RlmD [Simiduia litorea]|uniref:23S rRNA (uracil(1939)-C(5))-methyltransferase RlmD n=1 Tax=Simiduia litorea TaxID=1435348 RepID=UPI0036F39B87